MYTFFVSILTISIIIKIYLSSTYRTSRKHWITDPAIPVFVLHVLSLKFSARRAQSFDDTVVHREFHRDIRITTYTAPIVNATRHSPRSRIMANFLPPHTEPCRGLTPKTCRRTVRKCRHGKTVPREISLTHYWQKCALRAPPCERGCS